MRPPDRPLMTRRGRTPPRRDRATDGAADPRSRTMATRAMANATTNATTSAMTRHRVSSSRRARGWRTASRASSEDGRGTTEDAIDALAELSDGRWRVGRYRSKRKEHLVNELGDIVAEERSGSNIAEHVGWNDGGKLRFCVATVARELDLDEDEVGKKLVNLFALVPGMESRIGDVKMADVVRMTARVPDVAVAMVRLRDLLPEADLSKMVTARPSLLLEDFDDIARKIGELRECAPRLRWDAILSDFPHLWEIHDMRGNMEMLKEKLSVEDDDALTKLLGGRPELLLSVQSRHDMITYDNGTLAQVEAMVNGDRTSDGW